MKKNPIGVFDSGIGGTSILKEIVRLLPNENVIYLADSANAPYGQKSADEILSLCEKNADLLLSKGCKLIVVACNTATTNAISLLRKKYDVPFVGIEPAIKPAALNTKTNTIGILATKGTLNSNLFAHKIENYATKVEIIEVVGEGLVECLESGDFDSEYLQNLVNSYIKPMLDKGIDYLVLGCSHYPYLIPIIKKQVPLSVKIIDSGEAVAKQTKNILLKHDFLNDSSKKGELLFFTNVDKTTICKILESNFTNYLLESVKF